MLINVSEIQIKNRIRKDFGDIDGLAKSIEKNGLITPIAITSDHILIAGERRLMAIKRLGWNQIEANIMDVHDYEQILNREIEENENRKDFTPEEKVNFANELLQIEKIKAEERKKKHGGTAPGKKTLPFHGSEVKEKGEAMEMAAKKVGFSQGSYKRAKTVLDSGNREVIDLMNKGEKEGGLSIRGAYEKVMEPKRQEAKKEDKPIPKKPEKLEEIEIPAPASEPEQVEEQESKISLSYLDQVVNRFICLINPLYLAPNRFLEMDDDTKQKYIDKLNIVREWTDRIEKTIKTGRNWC